MTPEVRGPCNRAMPEGCSSALVGSLVSGPLTESDVVASRDEYAPDCTSAHRIAGPYYTAKWVRLTPCSLHRFLDSGPDVT